MNETVKKKCAGCGELHPVTKMYHYALGVWLCKSDDPTEPNPDCFWEYQSVTAW